MRDYDTRTGREKYLDYVFGERICKCNGKNDCSKGIHCFYKRAQAALNRAHDIRKFEIELLWKRAAYLATFQTILFAAFGVTFIEDGSNSTADFFRLVVSIVGIFSSFLWVLINKGSKFWHENWSDHIDMLEDKFEGKLHKTVLHKSGKHPFSVSRVNIYTSKLFFGVWAILAFIALIEWLLVVFFENQNWWCENWWHELINGNELWLIVSIVITVIAGVLFVLYYLLKSDFSDEHNIKEREMVKRKWADTTPDSQLPYSTKKCTSPST